MAGESSTGKPIIVPPDADIGTFVEMHIGPEQVTFDNLQTYSTKTEARRNTFGGYVSYYVDGGMVAYAGDIQEFRLMSGASADSPSLLLLETNSRVDASVTAEIENAGEYSPFDLLRELHASRGISGIAAQVKIGREGQYLEVLKHGIDRPLVIYIQDAIPTGGEYKIVSHVLPANRKLARLRLAAGQRAAIVDEVGNESPDVAGPLVLEDGKLRRFPKDLSQYVGRPSDPNSFVSDVFRQLNFGGRTILISGFETPAYNAKAADRFDALLSLIYLAASGDPKHITQAVVEVLGQERPDILAQIKPHASVVPPEVRNFGIPARIFASIAGRTPDTTQYSFYDNWRDLVNCIGLGMYSHETGRNIEWIELEGVLKPFKENVSASYDVRSSQRFNISLDDAEGGSISQRPVNITTDNTRYSFPNQEELFAAIFGAETLFNMRRQIEGVSLVIPRSDGQSTRVLLRVEQYLKLLSKLLESSESSRREEILSKYLGDFSTQTRGRNLSLNPDDSGITPDSRRAIHFAHVLLRQDL